MSNNITPAVEYVHISWEVWAENPTVWEKCIAFGDDTIVAEFSAQEAAWYRNDRYLYESSFEENLRSVSGLRELPEGFAEAVLLPYFFIGKTMHAYTYPELGFCVAEPLK